MYLFLILIVICLNYSLNQIINFNFELRNVTNFKYYDVGQIFLKDKHSNSEKPIIFEIYFSNYYQIFCSRLGYSSFGSKVFACQDKKGSRLGEFFV